MNFEVVRNNIADMRVDVIVCPSNTFLAEGSGASKAIYEKAGKMELKNACKKVVKQAKVGLAVPTPAFDLDAQIVLHAVVPKWKDGKHNEYALLSSAYETSLRIADKCSCESIVFPLLASGNNGFDKELAYEIAKETITSFEPKNKLSKVFLVVYDADTMEVMRKRGVEVEEYINETYILSNDERYNRVTETALEVMNYLNDPYNREEILEKGKKIADLVILAGAITGKGGKIVKAAKKVRTIAEIVPMDKKMIDVDFKE